MDSTKWIASINFHIYFLLQKMKDALLNITNCNVIILDWSENNGPPYAQAFANARAVGAQLALLLNKIIVSGTKFQILSIIRKKEKSL